jgi:hypothetical protein
VVDIAAYISVSMTAAHAVFTGPASTSPIDGRSPVKKKSRCMKRGVIGSPPVMALIGAWVDDRPGVSRIWLPCQLLA